LQLRFDTVLPVPDGGFGDADDLGHLALEQPQVHPSLADLLTDGEWMLWIAGKWLFSRGDAD